MSITVLLHELKLYHDLDFLKHFQSGITSCIFAHFMSAFSEVYLDNSNHIRRLNKNLDRLHTAGALDVEISSLPFLSPFPLPFEATKGCIHECLQLTTEEEEAIKRHHKRPRTTVFITRVILLSISFFGSYIFVSSSLLRAQRSDIARAFGLQASGGIKVVERIPRMARFIIFIRIIRLFLVLITVISRLFYQRSELTIDSYVNNSDTACFQNSVNHLNTTKMSKMAITIKTRK